MYICNDCENIFETPLTDEGIKICPSKRCGGSDIVEADRCQCGFHKPVDKWTCAVCEERVDMAFRSFFEDLTDDEKHYAADGIDLNKFMED